MPDSSESTVAKGDRFRDAVTGLLASAGFRELKKEVRKNFKKTDAVGVWEHDPLDGPTKYLVEAKNYSGSLPKSECVAFAQEYQTLLESGEADVAWLISKGPISPDGRAFIEAKSKERISCFTLEEFQRRLFRIDAYLHDVIAEYEQSGVDEYYIKPHTIEGESLRDRVDGWLELPSNNPMAIVGGYGLGKSTFARNLVASMARKALDDYSERIPILIPLGEVIYQTNVDGLIGAILANRHRVGGYHFELFSRLNQNGRFLVIFDGFDEMKHGMTFEMFERQISELLKLNVENAKILILGRDTAFHTDYEFQSIIHGKQRTLGGSVIPAKDRKPFIDVSIRGFSSDEAANFISRYFPYRVRKEQLPRSEKWIDERVAKIGDGRFKDLLSKPVHAEMLCEIATHEEESLDELSQFDLYDRFVHYLLEREALKPGRDPRFDRDTRRNLNSAVAWWLWTHERASTTTIEDVPMHIFADASKNVDHDFSETQIKRELTAGCLIEKGGSTFFFPHRSIQEFLVSEFLFFNQTNALRRPGVNPVEQTLSELSVEVADFLVGRIRSHEDKSSKALEWLSLLEGLHSRNVRLDTFSLFHKIGKLAAQQNWFNDEVIWHHWLRFFADNDSVSFSLRTTAARRRVSDMLGSMTHVRRSTAFATAYLACRALIETSEEGDDLKAQFLAAMIDFDFLEAQIRTATHTHGRNVVVTVKKGDSPILWAFLQVAKITRVNREVAVEFDLLAFLDFVSDLQHAGFEGPVGIEGSKPPGEPKNFEAIIVISGQSLIRAVSNRGNFAGERLDRFRRYLNDDDLRRKIRPLVVENLTTKHSSV